MAQSTTRDCGGGTAIVLVFGLILILGTFGGILKLLSTSAYHEVDTLTSHLRAVAVGEAGFAEVEGRLVAVPWEDRWFKGNPDVQYDLKAVGGTYSYLLRDVPTHPLSPPSSSTGSAWLPASGQADLLIKATYQRSTVVMYWRLTMPSDSLDSLARVVPSAYSHGPKEAPLEAGETDLLGQEVEGLVQVRDGNRNTFEALRPKLLGATRATDVASILGVVPPGPILDSLVAATGDAPRDDSTYIAAVITADSGIPAAPPAELPIDQSLTGPSPWVATGGNGPELWESFGSGLTWGGVASGAGLHREGWGDWGGDDDGAHRREEEHKRRDRETLGKEKIGEFLAWSQEADRRLSKLSTVLAGLGVDPVTGSDVGQVGRDVSAAQGALDAARQQILYAISQGDLSNDSPVTGAAVAAGAQAATAIRQAKHELPPGYDAANLLRH